MQKITPCLWSDGQAQAMAEFYTSIFPNSRIVRTDYYSEGATDPDGRFSAGDVLTVTLEIEGQAFMVLNGGPQFKFNEAISLMVDCADQAEIDTLWAKLTADGGEEGPCGWLKDKFGVSWQIVSDGFDRMLQDPDSTKVKRVWQAMMQMQKIDLAILQAAYDGN